MTEGSMKRLHKHPYKEIFIIQQGVSTFVSSSITLEAHTGQIIIVPADTPHMFMNLSNSRLKQIDIHVNKQFITDWLED
jgi:mannose-6-phosphate isomerase-like protein (cupin superfamily)